MSKDTFSGYPGVPGAPGSTEPSKDDRVRGEVLAQGTDAALIRTESGQVVLTDAKGSRRT